MSTYRLLAAGLVAAILSLRCACQGARAPKHACTRVNRRDAASPTTEYGSTPYSRSIDPRIG